TGKVRLRFEARITKFSDLAPDDMRAAFESD
ncbi:replicative DNA helicase, partial [Sphingomonas sp. LH128]